MFYVIFPKLAFENWRSEVSRRINLDDTTEIYKNNLKCQVFRNSIFSHWLNVVYSCVHVIIRTKYWISGFGCLEEAWWPWVHKFAGSNPTEAVGFFRAKKILNTPSFGGEVKPPVPCRRFTACKRSLNVTWKSGIFGQNSSTISHPCSSTFGC